MVSLCIFVVVCVVLWVVELSANDVMNQWFCNSAGLGLRSSQDDDHGSLVGIKDIDFVGRSEAETP